MNVVAQLLLLHVVIGVGVVYLLATIFGDVSEKTYHARKRSFLNKLLLPGRLADKQVWFKQQRRISWIGLGIAAVVYVTAMIKILDQFLKRT